MLPTVTSRLLVIAALPLAVLVLAGTALAVTATPTHTVGGPVQVVAAESMWGSIAAQIGGSRAHVTSIVSNPATDPHEYEPSAIDARELAGAQLVIVNGAGYDAWASKLLAANPDKHRVVIDVAQLVGAKKGANPHLWYAPHNVKRVIAALRHAYSQLDPGNASAYVNSSSFFQHVGLAGYYQQIASIRQRFHGTKVGASESIFAPLAKALALKLVTPPRFLNAISEGTDPTASDLKTIRSQITKRQIKVWVYNTQNSTPDVRRLNALARKHKIPVVPVSETITPAQATFQSWQVTQLLRLAQALGKK